MLTETPLAPPQAARAPVQPGMLVVGPPRSGFTLLLSILGRLIDRQGFAPDPRRRELQGIVDGATADVDRAVRAYFAQHIDPDDLLVSPEFGLLVGGPKWLHPHDPNSCCVRKYIGIRGRGDFLAVFTLPKRVMDYYDITHSHYHPGRWLEDTYYAEHTRLASIRNPLDVLNSSTFSLNALTGHYIDNCLKRPTNPLREKLALNKLTDLNFVEGLVAPQVDYWNDFLAVRDRFHVMRWEELITDPQRTILAVADQAGLRCSPAEARDMWIEMSYRNQTRFHVHNFRKGVIGDWKNHLVNEHLELLKAQGFDEFLQELGYEPIRYFDPRDYTLFQQTAAECLRKGTVHNQIDDEDLFIFAFNKSNFRSSKYDFVSYEGDGAVRIERSSIKDEPLLRGFMDAVDRVLEPAVRRLEEIGRRFAA